MSFQTLVEGSAIIHVSTGVISKKLPVFYNPEMTLNRDITVALFRALGRSGLKGCDLLAGNGVRSIRLLKETKRVFSQLIINDANPLAVKSINQHLKVNKVPTTKTIVTNLDANKLLATSAGFDYIDIDPFGSPNPFLDQSIQHLARDGILAVTATDTAALAGTSPAACLRKYWATPLRNYLQHEIGLRILIRKCQLLGAQYDKALVPLIAYTFQHYLRVILRCEKGKQAVDRILTQHAHLFWCPACLTTDVSRQLTDVRRQMTPLCRCARERLIAGPLWMGGLGDAKLLRAMSKDVPSDDAAALIELLANEAAIPQVGFYDIHELSSTLKISPPKIEDVIQRIRKAGYDVARAHYTQTSLKSMIPLSELKRLLKITN